MTAADDAREALRVAREALATAEAAARAAGVDPQTVVPADEGGVRRSAIEFVDRPATSLVEGMQSGNVGYEAGEGPVCRMRLATEADGSVGLAFSDQEGRVRLRLGLDEHGKPSVELFGPNGGPAGSLGR